ncbi:MAG: T9SS type A sorting domain-containing protein, partial [Bacteroidia bacterium]|nr:T9SS type A sorting domain-containing protein [Bacteroidia bacterium]
LDRSKLFIYPNPASRTLFIQTEPGKRYNELVIYDMQLKTLVRQPFQESTDISSLPAGTYIISVSDNDGRIYSSRFIKND